MVEIPIASSVRIRYAKGMWNSQRDAVKATNRSAPARASSAADRAYEELLAMLMSRSLSTGEVIMERRLASTFGISRTPMREALRRLEGEGLIERQASGALIVREMTVRDVIEALNIRQLLESEGAAIAATRMPIDAVDKLIARIEKLRKVTTPDAGQHWTLDDDIHDGIAAATGNELLRSIIRLLRQRSQMFNLVRLPDRLEPGCKEHIKLLKAIRARNADTAREAMTTHLEMAKAAIVKNLKVF